MRWYRIGRYHFDGQTLMWEYPRAHSERVVDAHAETDHAGEDGRERRDVGEGAKGAVLRDQGVGPVTAGRCRPPGATREGVRRRQLRRLQLSDRLACDGRRSNSRIVVYPAIRTGKAVA